jgi:hypothetical protein
MTSHKPASEASTQDIDINQEMVGSAAGDAPLSAEEHPFQAHPDHAEAVRIALDAIHQLVEDQPGFADVLRAAQTTDEARKALLEQGIEITSEALWRHRGSLLKDGHPTWRG